MLIPCELVVILERLFGRRLGGEVVLPPLAGRIAIYLRALEYVEKDLRLFAYVLGHRRLVTAYACKKIDEVLLECMCRDPRIIPGDYRKRLPEKAYIVQYTERLYMRDKVYEAIHPETAYQLAAE